MEKLLIKYAQVILNTCLKVEKNQPLFISYNVARRDFARIVAEEAYKIGVKDIYFDASDPYLKHDALLNLNEKELKQSSFWNHQVWNDYAKKGAAFVMLASETPGLMKDVDPDKLNALTIYGYETREKFDELRSKSMVPWCIAAVPTLEWAKEVFPDSKDPEKDLWYKIFNICGIDSSSPEKLWDKKINTLSDRCQKLNSYKFKTLKYKNSLGTDLAIDLPLNHIWCSGNEKLTNKKEVLVNFPTEEVFTSPDCKSARGIVYSSKPLAYQDNIIDEFYIKFDKGVAIECHAKKGQKILENIISGCHNSNRLGEVALVEYDSAISKSNIIFYETLFDENASCHLALGDSFPECLKGGTKMTRSELLNNNLNFCANHVDFMIGTKDLEIIGVTEDGTEVPIFQNGNFTKEFK